MLEGGLSESGRDLLGRGTVAEDRQRRFRQSRHGIGRSSGVFPARPIHRVFEGIEAANGAAIGNAVWRLQDQTLDSQTFRAGAEAERGHRKPHYGGGHAPEIISKRESIISGSRSV